MSTLSLLIKPVSGRCNMRCKYCFYNSLADNRSNKVFEVMSENTLENVVRKAFIYADECVSFVFQGGEPTLAGMDYYRSLISLQKKYNIRNIRVLNSIQTNGYAMDDGWADFLASNRFLVGLSMDGTKEIHDRNRLNAAGEGTYERVKAAAEILKRHNAEFNILCVVTKDVAINAAEVYNSLKSYGYLQFIPCIDGFNEGEQEYSLTAELYGAFLKKTFSLYADDFMRGKYVSVRNFDNYLNILRGFPPENCAMCGVCGSYFLIEGDGSCFPCDFYVLDQWKTGNINEQSFMRCERSEAALRFVDRSRHVSGECRECRWLNLCRGGCARDREPFVNGKMSLNRYCESYRELFNTSFETMRIIAEKISDSEADVRLLQPQTGL